MPRMGSEPHTRAAALLALALLIAAGCSRARDEARDDDPLRPPSGTTDGPPPWEGDPVDCSHAEVERTYVGCDFYPTVTPNLVGTYFDYAVVVANASTQAARVTIDRGGNEITGGEVPAGGLRKFFLPWVETKHFMGKCDTDLSPAFTASALTPGGAYHLRSTVPVTVYQFNPLQYKGQGGPPGKDWSECKKRCIFGCNSYTNDASLLLPSSALTGNYWVTVRKGMYFKEESGTIQFPGYFLVTGLHDGTVVKVRVGAKGQVRAGGGIPDAGPSEVFNFALGRGDVMRVLGTTQTDLAGTQVQASHPVQIIAGMPCTHEPDDRQACDHIEETVMPAETLGRRYFVTMPTAPRGDTRGHSVRLVGAADGTILSYPGGAPTGAPTKLSAGQVADLGIVTSDFEVVGDKGFAVVTLMLASSMVDAPLSGRGDPSQSNATPVEQYRTRHVFLAPDDYDVSYADLVIPDGAMVKLDGAPLSVQPRPISSGFGVARVKLGPGTEGAHLVESDKAVGLQVMGYGFATSYQFPGGLNLRGIAPPPPVIP